MSGLERLKLRLDYYGGSNQQTRMEQDKLRSLKKALLYSYQSQTIVIHDQEFRALINSDKQTGDYDTKIISLPYEDIELTHTASEKTSQSQKDTLVKSGDVFTWKENDTHWIIFLQYLTETAYFRAQIRRCDQTTEINGEKYWIYVRGPMETSIPWNQKNETEWNDMNYSLVIYITKNEDTINFFHRFSKLKIAEEVTGINRTWQVVGVNQFYGDGIIEVYLDEEFENSIADAREEEIKQEEKDSAADAVSAISGPSLVSAYDEVIYSVEETDESTDWYLLPDGIESEKIVIEDENTQEKLSPQRRNRKVGKYTLQRQSETSVKVFINVGKGFFELYHGADMIKVLIE